MTALLEGRDLSFSYGERRVLSGVDLSLEPGELVVLVGPNGAGKSTLLRVLLGILHPDGGTVHLGGRPIETLDRRAIARAVAFVPQDARADFDFTVRELVAMGRTPHLGRFEPERQADLDAVDRALEATETRAFQHRLVSELSGGERQRVHLARAIAQATDVLLLDEPTSSLDIAHQLELMTLVRGLVQAGKAAAVALHDLTLAARFADRMVVLAGGAVVASGTPERVVTEAMLAQHFKIRARVERDPDDGVVVVVPLGPAVL